MLRTHVDVLQTDRENVQVENRSFACSIKTTIEEQNLVYNSYNHLNNLLSTSLSYFFFISVSVLISRYFILFYSLLHLCYATINLFTTDVTKSIYLVDINESVLLLFVLRVIIKMLLVLQYFRELYLSYVSGILSSRPVTSR